jgi:hypothetical protein
MPDQQPPASTTEADGPPVKPPAFPLLKEGDAPIFETGAELLGDPRGGYLPDPELLSILDPTPIPPKPDYLKPLAALLVAAMLLIAVRVIWYYSTNHVDLGSSPLEQRGQPLPSRLPAANPAAADDTIYFAPDGVTLPVLLSKSDARGNAPGKVVILMVIDAKGKPVNPQVWQGLTPDLNIRALGAIGHWRFRPATKDGKPVPVTAQVAVGFQRE